MKPINLIQIGHVGDSMNDLDPKPMLQNLKEHIGDMNFILIVHNNESSEVRQFSNMPPDIQFGLLTAVTEGTGEAVEKLKKENQH